MHTMGCDSMAWGEEAARNSLCGKGVEPTMARSEQMIENGNDMNEEMPVVLYTSIPRLMAR